MIKQPLSKQERLEQISNLVLSKGEAGLDELVVLLGVSRMTIHRDLEELEGRGVLRKIRNGATAQPSSAFESNVEFRMTRAIEAKSRLAKYAASLVEPGDVILLDEATTLLPMLGHLSAIEDLTIISNFLPIQAAVAKLTSIKLIGLCGEYISQYNTFSGPLCEQSIQQLKINRFFTSTTAIDGGGAFHPNSIIASTKRAMIQASVHRYMLADGSKFSRTALHKFADLDEFDQIVTDSPLAAEHLVSMGHLTDRLVIVPQ